jgi:demethoxyubiquinone hydroxylase (CLK1/Coq7/Cat5 family)
VATDPVLTVYYDGDCPLCRREIGFYRGCRGADAVTWVDVAAARAAPAADLSRADALARFHVRNADGRLVDGGPAFAALWRALPGFRPLGRLFGSALLRPLLARAYDAFLPLRPHLQRLAAARDVRLADGAPVPRWLVGELRSDHAGETGAVWIYRAILTMSRDDRVRAFATAHLATERRHLAEIESVLPRAARSRLLPAWRVAGFLTGAIPALCGPRAVYATIASVEEFVDRHYRAQVDRLDREAILPALRDLLERCRVDEVDHRDEARHALDRPPGPILRLWSAVVGRGSAAAVVLARRI